MNSLSQFQNSQQSDKLGLKKAQYNINANKNIHYRGCREPGLVTYAGGAGLSHVLPLNQKLQ